MDIIKNLRTEQVHIAETSCVATSTPQWFVEHRNEKGNVTHPITHNNKLNIFVCGKDGFAAIAEDIANAEDSIDLVCWGFDPGMELVRNRYYWPRSSQVYGDLLIAAGMRGVRVRILIWYNLLGSRKQKNMPGHSHGTSPWYTQEADSEIQKLNAKGSLELIREHARINRHKPNWNISGDQLAAMAREEYCHSWYNAAFKGKLTGISIRKRDGDFGSICSALGREAIQPDPTEMGLLTGFGTHHQKPILIDFDYLNGSKAVGYVMGLNSLTDYWDTAEHALDNPLREQGGEKTTGEKTQGVEGLDDFDTLKPYRDYACRLDGGRALIAIHENFERAWKRAGGETSAKKYTCDHPPSALLREAHNAGSTVQIVRTQPEEDDFTIKEIYFNATRVAAAGTGYLYMENQYFQYQEWASHLLDIRRNVVAGWKRGCGKIGKTLEDFPILHVFVVIPAPELSNMIPRTYDTLATLGQQDGMIGQSKLIDTANEQHRRQQTAPKQAFMGDAVDRRANRPHELPEVVKYANQITIPSKSILENNFGLRVCVAMLNSCEFNQKMRRWRYREIYVHSKLLIADDSFLTLGSANLNQRSMAVDSEINLATNDAGHAKELRTRVWTQLAGKENCGGNATFEEISITFKNWKILMTRNSAKQKAVSTEPKAKAMSGLIVSLADGRSSTTRFA